MNSFPPVPTRFNFTTFHEAVTRLAVLTSLALLSPVAVHAGAVPFSWGNGGNGSLGNNTLSRAPALAGIRRAEESGK
jgi:hypothetical protein